MAYSLLGKAFEKQTEKGVNVIKSLYPSNKLKQICGCISTKLDDWFNSCYVKRNCYIARFYKKDGAD